MSVESRLSSSSPCECEGGSGASVSSGPPKKRGSISRLSALFGSSSPTSPGPKRKEEKEKEKLRKKEEKEKEKQERLQRRKERAKTYDPTRRQITKENIEAGW